MGFFDWVTKTAKTAWAGLKKVGGTVGGALKQAAVWTKAKAAPAVWGVIKSVATTVHDDAKGIVNFVGARVTQAQDITGKLVGGVSSLLSSPLLLPALAVGGIVLLKFLPK